ncbi:coiled-coil domain-containing protein [Phytohabitans kaempferiae]|uniref:Coiled-coil domain-containing protein n=1 Tax=Phytohabitans kaempferiae TaxID=1620943 RepID=A0ABV6MFJ2_9ACTN
MAHARSRVSLVAVLFAAAFALIGLPAEPAAAAPTDDEGGTATLRQQLDAASKGFIAAQDTLNKSKKRQQELTTQLAQLERDLVAKSEVLGEVANVAYRRGRLGPISAMLNSTSPEGFIDRAAALDAVAATEDKKLRDLLDTKDQASKAKLAIDGEIREQQKQVEVMAARKKQAENALKAAGGGQDASGPPVGSGATAVAARFTGGSGCTIRPDPTSKQGCITPRTSHAYKQAQAAGFGIFVSCYRPGSSGEHPLGQACDFAVDKDDIFGGAASGAARTYGNNLARFYVNNASRLGVMYVIWFRQIWLPSSGWKSYGGCCGPSEHHTNHVHLSVID